MCELDSYESSTVLKPIVITIPQRRFVSTTQNPSMPYKDSLV